MRKLYLDSDASWTDAKGGSLTLVGDDFTTGSDLTPTEDSSSTKGTILKLNPADADKSIASLTFYGMYFGLYSVIIRSRTTVNAGSAVVYTVKAYANETLLTTYEIKEQDYTARDKWESLGVGVDFQGKTGDNLRIDISRESEYTGEAVIDFDYVQVAPAPVAINAIR